MEKFEVLAVFRVVDHITRPIKEMEKAVAGLRKSIEKTKEALDKMQNIGTRMASMGAAISAPFAGATYLAMSFDKAMNEASTLVDMSLQEFRKKYDKEILNLAKELGQSPDQVARAFYQAISSGLDPDKAISFLKQAGKAAIAGVSDIFTATDGLTTALNAWKEFGYTVGQLSDYMFLAVKAGKTTFREIAASIGNVAPIAAKAGVSIQEVLAAMATATTQGATTSEAFTGIRAAIEAIMNPASQAEKWFEKLGVQIDANTLKQKALKGTLEILSKAIRNYTDDEAEQKKILAEIFGQVEGLNQVFAITGAGGKKFAEILQMMGKSAGATDKAFKKMAQSASFQLDQMKASLQVLGISIGTLLLPPLKAMIDMFNMALSPIVKFIQAHQTLAKVLVYPAAGLGVFLTVVGSLMATIGFLGQGILNFVAILPGLISGLTAAAGAVMSFSAALLVNPITWVVAGIAALAAAGYYLYKNWDAVFEEIKGLFQGIVSFFSTAWQKFMSVFLWTNPITAPIMALKKLYDFAKSINLFETGKQIIEGLWKGLVSMAKKPIEAVEHIGNSIKEKFKSLLGISSPSKLFMQFGHFLNEGLGLGMLKSLGTVESAVKKVFSALDFPDKKGIQLLPRLAFEGFKSLTLPTSLAVSLLSPANAISSPKVLQTERFLKAEKVLREKLVSEKVVEREPSNINITLSFSPVINTKNKEEVKQVLQAYLPDFVRQVEEAIRKLEEQRARRSY